MVKANGSDNYPSDMNITNRTLASLLLIGATALTGCGGDSDSSSADSSTDSASNSSTRTSSSSSDTSTSTSTNTDDTDGETVDMSDTAECIANDWVLMGEQLEQLFANGPMASLPGFTVAAVGAGAVTFRANGTYHYVPNFEVTISVGDISGTGTWAGTLDGTWEVDGDQITMAQTENNVTGSISMMGQEIAMPTNRTFSGTATVTDCQPASMTTSLDSPLGAIVQTLVAA